MTIMFVHNPDLRHWSFLWKAFTRNEFWYSDAGFLQVQQFRNYRPLFLVWCWLDYHLFGLNPAPWHASILAMYLLGSGWCSRFPAASPVDRRSALLAASLFALTPVHVAAVVWMASYMLRARHRAWTGAFYLIIMPRADGSGRSWTAAIALYACALLCHESLTAFPALVACYAFLFDPNDLEAGAALESSGASLWMRARRAVIWQAPFAVELLIYFFVRRLVLGFFVSNPYYYINLLTDAQAVLTVPLVLATYLADVADAVADTA